MEITNRDKKLLVYLLAISIIAGTYFFGARPFLDKQMALDEEISSLQMQVDHYSQVYNNQAEYESKASEAEWQYQDMMSKFFAGLDQDRTLVMIRDIETNTGTWISKVAFQETQVMVGASSDGSTNVEETTEATDASETATPVSITGVKQDLSIDYSAGYADFKRFLEQVKNNQQRLYISSMNASYSLESGRVTGSLILSQYALDGAGIEKQVPDLSGIGTGVGNIFTSGDSADAIFGTLENDADTSEPAGEITENPEESGEESGEDAAGETEDTENVENPEPSEGPSKPQGPAGGII